MRCIIKRRAEFSACYRYWLPELSPKENQQNFALKNREIVRGHNYVLYISIAGELDKYGMVLNFSGLKQVVKREVTDQLDGSIINEVWAEFQATPPATENLARVIWQRLVPNLPIVNIQLFENPKVWAEYEGNEMEAYITVANSFSAAHRLALDVLSLEENLEIYGKCGRPNGHGHNYHLEVTIKGQINSQTGTIVDFVALEKVVEELAVEPLDHTFLNKDIPYFAKVVPTAENIAAYIGYILLEPIRELGAELHKIKLSETPNNYCELYAADLGESSMESHSRAYVKTKDIGCALRASQYI
ncbi:MAG: 6-pyruvoyl tetrahydropterin synthase [Oscillatoria sp. SIO1A7]|nr:6-pyruvoyl tetrahydropterin synthase [Oscillatoria sp. SIO1A7]